MSGLDFLAVTALAAIANKSKADQAKADTVKQNAEKVKDAAALAKMESSAVGLVGNNYPNPLDEFRTYSTHFILTASNASEAFRKSVDDNNGVPSIISKASSKQVGEKIQLDDNDSTSAYLILDSRRHSQYSITDVEFETMFGSKADHVNALAILGTLKMKLTDNTGLSFFNLILDLSRNILQTTSTSLYFMLNIMFIGHPDDGSDPVNVSTSSILLNLTGLAFELTSSAGLFELSFLEATSLGGGGISTIGAGIETDYLGDVKVITTEGASNTVGSLLDSLENQLNVQSLEYYQKFTNTAGKNNKDEKNKKIKYGKLVQYMITMPDEIRKYPVNNASASSNKEKTFKADKPGGYPDNNNIPQDKQEGNPPGIYTSITLAQSSTITSAILAILKTSNEFLKKSSDDFIKENKGEFVRSTISNTSDNNTYVLHFDTFLNEIVSNDRIFAEFKHKNAINLISYDYIFTGHNSHILDFKLAYNPAMALTSIDMQSSFGKHRSAEVAEAGQKKADVKDAGKGTDKTKEYSAILRPQDPVFFALSTKNAKSNNVDQYNEADNKETAIEAFRNKQNFAKTYAKINFFGSMQAELVIRGNPSIIKKCGDRAERNGIPPHNSIASAEILNSIVGSGANTAGGNFSKLIKPGLINAKNQYIESYLKPKRDAAKARKNINDDLLNGIDLATLPVYVKLNIKYPNVDYNGNFIDGEDMFTSDFFFNGVYNILKVKTHWQSGNFTQTFYLIPWDADNSVAHGDDDYND